MSDHSPETIKKHVAIYVRVFVALAALTLITVAVSYWHLPVLAAVGVALLIACFKGTLVAAFFMHLAKEKKVILYPLILVLFFFLFLLIAPTISRF